jgi:hypothetical protein
MSWRRTRLCKIRPVLGRSVSGTSSATASQENVLPITAAARIASASSGVSRSMRAAMSAWIVGGTAIAARDGARSSSAPSSRSICTISSTNSGLPSPASAIRRRSPSSIRPPCTRSSIMVSVSDRSSGAIRIVVALGSCVNHSGRSSNSSLRARQRISTGTSRAERAT